MRNRLKNYVLGREGLRLDSLAREERVQSEIGWVYWFAIFGMVAWILSQPFFTLVRRNSFLGFPWPLWLAGIVVSSKVYAYYLIRAKNIIKGDEWRLAFFVFVLVTIGFVTSFSFFNCSLDRRIPTVHETIIIEKQYERRGFLAVSDWKEPKQRVMVPVKVPLFHSVKAGDVVRVKVKPGFLGCEFLLDVTHP